MSLQLFNTLGRKKQLFTPIHPGKVGLYTCGLTVYNYAHIGNMRAYLFEDILVRVLQYNNYQLNRVMNITDVGHLTSDADSGEDKMLKGAQREGKTVWDIAEFYTKAFKEDMKKLNILPPDVWCKATDHIPEMIALIQRLEAKGFTYTAGGNVYYDITKFKTYGDLARLKLEELEAGARIDVDKNKKNPHDFVLWFTKSKFADQDMKWDSPWGAGYPGWHIECSAMSLKYLGEQFDIHCGGIDHIPVHHTNEIAQTEGATGRKWVNYWMHSDFLILDKQKMAKSGENFITLKTVIDKGFDPLDYRYFTLGTHYRIPLAFSWEALEGACNARRKIMEHVKEFADSTAQNTTAQDTTAQTAMHKNENLYRQQFLDTINDDLNMPNALAVLWTVIKDKTLSGKQKFLILSDFDKVLGLNLTELESAKAPLSSEEQFLLDERTAARKQLNWQRSDELRDELKKRGIIVEDGPGGSRWKRAR